jgi:hypothetical protein
MAVDSRRRFLQFGAGLFGLAATGQLNAQQQPPADQNAQTASQPKKPAITYDAATQTLTINEETAFIDLDTRYGDNYGKLLINNEPFEAKGIPKTNDPYEKVGITAWNSEVKTVVLGPKMATLKVSSGALASMFNKNDSVFIDNPAGKCMVELDDSILKKLNPNMASLSQRLLTDPPASQEKPIPEFHFGLHGGDENEKTRNANLFVRNALGINIGTMPTIRYDKFNDDFAQSSNIGLSTINATLADRMIANSIINDAPTRLESDFKSAVIEAKRNSPPLIYTYEGDGKGGITIRGNWVAVMPDLGASVAANNVTVLGKTLLADFKTANEKKQFVNVNGTEGNIDTLDLTPFLDAIKDNPGGKEVVKVTRNPVDGLSLEATNYRAPQATSTGAYFNILGVEFTSKTMEFVKIGNDSFPVPYGWEKDKDEFFKNIEKAIAKHLGKENLIATSWQHRVGENRGFSPNP